MTIDYRIIAFSPDLPAELVKAVEGAPILSPNVITGNDHTITFGYGYTFVKVTNLRGQSELARVSRTV